MLLPVIGIIDSNTKSFLVKFPIVSNDDSLESLYFILNIVSRLILLLKYIDQYECFSYSALNLDNFILFFVH